jgi:hypothetical protein
VIRGSGVAAAGASLWNAEGATERKKLPEGGLLRDHWGVEEQIFGTEYQGNN